MTPILSKKSISIVPQPAIRLVVDRKPGRRRTDLIDPGYVFLKMFIVSHLAAFAVGYILAR